jgi:hypothetical protein
LDRDESILDLDDPHRRLIAALADAGFPVVASSAGGNAFGNISSQQNYSALAFGSAERYRATQVFFLAESMGAVAAVNVMANNKSLSVAGLAAISPLLNLGALPAQYRPAAEDANSGVSIFDLSPLGLPAASIRGGNFRFYVTPDDELVPTEDNATAFQRKFGSVANVSMVACSGEHLNPSCIQERDIVGWFKSLTLS